jgi:hypothetical protein
MLNNIELIKDNMTTVDTQYLINAPGTTVCWTMWARTEHTYVVVIM